MKDSCDVRVGHRLLHEKLHLFFVIVPEVRPQRPANGVSGGLWHCKENELMTVRDYQRLVPLKRFGPADYNSSTARVNDMDFGPTHRMLQRVDVSALVERVLSTDDALWHSDEELRTVLTGTRPTQSIFLYYTNARYMPHDRKIKQDDVLKRSGFDWFSGAVLPIVDDICAQYEPGGTIVQCQIAKLLPGATIRRHQDVSPLLRASHRIHVPLITWPEVVFYIDDKPFVFEAGQAFELNNQKFHEVQHLGTKDRYHLIFDLLPANYDPKPMAMIAESGLAPVIPKSS